MAEVIVKTKMSPQKKYLLHSLIGMVIMFGFGFLPPFSPVTSLGMKYLGILLGLIYLWSLVEMLWPSILGLVALILTGAISGAELTPKAFGTDMILIVILSLAVVFALANTGIFDYATNWLLSRKSLQGHPWRLTAAILFGAYGINAVGDSMALLFLLWQLVYSIADQAGMKRTHPYCGVMVVGLILAYVGGINTLPFKPSYLFIIGTFQKITGMASIPMITGLVMNLAIYLSTLFFYILLMRFVLRIDLSPLKNSSTNAFIKELPPMNKTQKFSVFYLIFFIVMLMLPGTISLFTQGTLSQMLQNLGTVGMCYFLFALLCIVRIEGKPILVFKNVAHLVQWDAVALMAVAFTLSPLLTAESTGISQWMTQVVNPLLGGHSAYVFTVMALIITICLTNVANNTVIMILMMTIIGAYVQPLGLNIPVIAFLMMSMSQTAYLLPASSFYGALVHSQAEIVSKKYLYIGAVMSILAAILCMFLVGIPLGSFFFK